MAAVSNSGSSSTTSFSTSSSFSKGPVKPNLTRTAIVAARLKRVVKARIIEFAPKYLATIKAMNLTALAPRVCFEASKNATLDFRVGLRDKKIIIKISVAFLARPTDLERFTPIGTFLHRAKKKQRRDFWALRELCRKPALWDAGKRFLLSHELAHIYHHHICRNPATHAESRRDEKQADLTATEFSEDIEIEGGIRFFQIVGKYQQIEEEDHPAPHVRVAYLQTRRDALRSGKAVRSPVLPARPLPTDRPSAKIN